MAYEPSNTPRPVLTLQSAAGPVTVMFTAEPEELSMRRHFIHECGWSEKEYRRIENFAWFSACVALYRDGEVIPKTCEQYLGACCYRSEREFFTTYAGDYFADMVCEAAKESGEADLIATAEAWRAKLRAEAEAQRKVRA